MPTITMDQAIDVGSSVFAAHKKDDLQMTFAKTNYQALNDAFGKDKMILSGGDQIKSWITLKDTGNAKHVGTGWDEDSHNPRNINVEVVTKWFQATTNTDYSRVELGYTQDDKLRTYRYLQGQKLNMFREFADLLYDAMWTTPSSATDTLSPHGFPAWLSEGDDNSEGAFTGYKAQYSTGGTEYNVGGVVSTSASNARWASFYGDHNGELGDNLLDLIDFAMMETYFIPPIIPAKVDNPTNMHNFRFFTNSTIRRNINGLLRKSDDRIGSDLAKYSGVPFYQGIPVLYVQALNTADTDTYGTDPLFGVNMDYLDVYVSKANNFVVSPPKPRDAQHNILSVYLDLSYTYHCKNRQRLGFLLNQQ